MSEENVEIVRRIFTTINDGFDLPRELYDPDHELDLSDQAGGVHRGVDAALEQMRPYWGRLRTSVMRSKR